MIGSEKTRTGFGSRSNPGDVGLDQRSLVMRPRLRVRKSHGLPKLFRTFIVPRITTKLVAYCTLAALGRSSSWRLSLSNFLLLLLCLVPSPTPPHPPSPLLTQPLHLTGTQLLYSVWSNLWLLRSCLGSQPLGATGCAGLVALTGDPIHLLRLDPCDLMLALDILLIPGLWDLVALHGPVSGPGCLRLAVTLRESLSLSSSSSGFHSTFIWPALSLYYVSGWEVCSNNILFKMCL